MSATPKISEFDPNLVPSQIRALRALDNLNYDYVNEIMLSGSVGSAKTLLAAHIISLHAIENPGAIIGVGRLALPDLKDTLISVIREHLAEIPIQYSSSSGDIFFPNGSKILAFSWIDKRYKKIRSYEFSMFVVEELTENHTKEIYDEVKMRVRLPTVRNKLILGVTNPDSPLHWAYEYFIGSKKENRYVFYSRTDENPFLPGSYIKGLKETLDPKMYRRMVLGEWLEIAGETVYYNYDGERNFKDDDYKINASFPIHISFDFNIGEGKPFSVALFQYYGGCFHFFDEVVLDSTNTELALQEIESRDIFENKNLFIINGDATGSSRSTNSNQSDYDVIEKYLNKVRRRDLSPIQFIKQVPRSNPQIRERHNIVNAQFFNELGETRLFIYKKCKTLDKGFKLTKLKKGANYLEDDGPAHPYQHITTSAGYGIVSEIKKEKRSRQQIEELTR